MDTKELIQAFLNGKREGSNNGRTLLIFGDKLISYSTCIAQHTPEGDVIVNMSKCHSVTTWKQIEKLVLEMIKQHIVYHSVTDLPKDATDLI